MKKALVTGADGFIGSHLVEQLLEMGVAVRAFVLYNSFNSFGWLDTLPKDKLAQIEIFTGDIRDPNGTRQAMEGCDTVFHLAALIGIPYSYHSPDSYVDVNIKGTLNVLQAARQLGTERILVTSTSEVYGSAQFIPISEAHPFQGQSPYSASKIGADRMAEAFWRSFDLPVTIVRPFNTYGPRQSARAVIPTIITQLLSGQPEILLGDLSPTRDWTFVGDMVRAFVMIAQEPKTIGKELNVASGEETSIGDLARHLVEKINPRAQVVLDPQRVRPANSEVNRLVGDAGLLRELTGWKPIFSLVHGLDDTVDWFRDPVHLQGYKADRYNV